ncbi:MAG: hypothetical protein Q4P36_01095 [Bowdeniella nasicola]|nr:hypothetical protein [Bowdeniella nasicola]
MTYALWIGGLLSAVLALWAVMFAILDRAVILKQLIVAGVVEVVVLVVMMLVIIAQVGGVHLSDPITLWGYLLTCLILYPIGGAWALVDRTRVSSLALAVLAISQTVCMWRIWVVFSA